MKVRIYLDPSQLSHDEGQGPFRELAVAAGVEMRVKRGETYMHLKSYAVDGLTLRTGAANFSASGEKQQDNDVIITENQEAVAAFEKDFEMMFASGEPYGE